MVDKSIPTQSPIPPFLEFLPQCRVILCRGHACCFTLSSIERHLRNIYYLESCLEKAGRMHLDAIQTLDVAFDQTAVRIPLETASRINGLEVFSGYRCDHPTCDFICVSVHVARGHCKTHGWHIRRGQKKSVSYTKVFFQKLLKQRTRLSYFVVARLWPRTCPSIPSLG